MRRLLIAVFGLALGPLAGCNVETCRSQGDCSFGSYCVLEVSGSGEASGQCVQDCLTAEDCPTANPSVERPICTNEGRCRVEARPPRLFVVEPEVDTLFEEGTRRLRVTGEVETAAESVTITVVSRTEGTCFGGPKRSVTVDNPSPGTFSSLPFVVDRVLVDPGLTNLSVTAAVQSSRRTSQVLVEIPCPGCADIAVEAPAHNSAVAGLVAPRLAGRIDPAPSRALWRVHSSAGDVFDGTLLVDGGGGFRLDRLPLFAGPNRVEVVVTGLGQGLGEARCSTAVVSSVAQERGLRAVMSWDGATADVDLHLVGPGGVFGEPTNSLSPRSPTPVFGGEVADDFDGLGPEVLRLEAMPDGVYGVIVEPVTDGADPGSNVFVRLLFEGRALTSGPIGPAYLSAKRGEIWVLGALRVAGGRAELVEVDEIVEIANPPTQPPSAWPMLY